MFSQTLWYAFAIYLIGVGFVLYMRPSLMFGPGGTWREFGLADDEQCTMFPFWLFSIVWAIMSYAIATMIMILVAGLAVKEEPEGLEIFSESDNIKPVSQTNNFKIPKEIATNSNIKSSNVGNNLGNRAGYYVLNTSKGEPSYVFVGNSPPSDELIENIVNQRF
jgi:hypothetical protein